MTVISNNNKGIVKRIFGDEVYKKTHVIHNFVNLGDFYPDDSHNNELRKKLGFSKKDTLLFSLSRLDGSKKIDLILKAMSLIGSDIMNIKLIIGGTGPDKERLVELVRKYNLGDNVIFIGYINDADILKYYNLIDILIYCGVEANYVLTAFEAMACKKIVIGPSCTFDEIISDKKEGFLFKADDANDLAQKISYVVKNKDKMNVIGENGLNRVKHNFTEDNFFQNFLDAIKDTK